MSRFVKIICLGLWFLLALVPDIGARIATIDDSTALAAYFALLGWTSFGICAAACISSAAIRWSGAVVFAAAALLFTGFGQVTGQFLTYDAFINLLNSRAFVDDAYAQYGGKLWWSAALSLLLLLGIGLPARGRLALPNWLAPVPYVVVASIAAILFLRGGEGARGLPASYPTLAYASLYGIEFALSPNRIREGVYLQRTSEPVDHIVLVIDESVSGHYLDINSPSGVETGLSRQWPGITISNFGVVPSITNCSIGSNLALRFGGTRENYRNRIAAGPSIWAFAKSAGMKTVYIDAQRTGGALHNGMNDEEVALIDRFFQFDDDPVLTRDSRVAEQIAIEVSKPEPSFIVANKVGAHFPVHDKFPDEYMTYRPTLPRGQFTDVSDTGNREGFDGSAESWRQYRNAYRNTIAWNVGAFFDRLLATADLSSSALIYTSDHGQNLREDGSSGLSTHCNADPGGSEGAVPLVYIAGADVLPLAKEIRGNGSHYRIFPTLLRLMGYDPKRAQQIYGPDLSDTSEEPETFNTRFNARLGQLPQWQSIDAETLLIPDDQDAEN